MLNILYGTWTKLRLELGSYTLFLWIYACLVTFRQCGVILVILPLAHVQLLTICLRQVLFLLWVSSNNIGQYWTLSAGWHLNHLESYVLICIHLPYPVRILMFINVYQCCEWNRFSLAPPPRQKSSCECGHKDTAVHREQQAWRTCLASEQWNLRWRKLSYFYASFINFAILHHVTLYGPKANLLASWYVVWNLSFLVMSRNMSHIVTPKDKELAFVMQTGELALEKPRFPSKRKCQDCRTIRFNIIQSHWQRSTGYDRFIVQSASGSFWQFVLFWVG